MKYPISKEIYFKAWSYAILSKNYTDLQGAGWDKQYDKIKRIFQGDIGQHFFYEIGKVNNVDVKLKETLFTDSDHGDLYVWGEIIDVKSSIVPFTIMPPQVQAKELNNKIDKYMFCIIDKEFKWIEPAGYIDKEIMIQDRYLIKYGELIPLLQRENRFQCGSYFYTDKLKPFKNFFYENLWKEKEAHH